MPAKKSTKKSTKSRKSRKTGASTAASEEVVMWLRLPKTMTVEQLARLGLQMTLASAAPRA